MDAGRPVSSAEIRAEAAAWLARLHADDRTAADEAAFRAWRTASPAHASAFDHLTEMWTAAGGIATQGAPAIRPEPRTGSRRLMLTGGAALLAGAAGFGVWEAAFAGVYQTDVGEQKHVSLPDGSQVFLDTDTRIRARFERKARTLTLYRGRANLRIAADPGRPFIVRSSGGAVASPRAALDVRLEGARLSVVVLQGEATIQPPGPDAGRRRADLLTTGVRAVMDDGHPAAIDRPELAPLTAWQNGQAIFDDEPLSQAAAEMNRYSTVKLRIGDAAAARMRISGVYRVGDNVAFARSVARLLPLSVESRNDDIVLASADPGVSPAL